jgi:hypothetical protein
MVLVIDKTIGSQSAHLVIDIDEMKRILLSILLALAVIQLLSYYLVGKKRLITSIDFAYNNEFIIERPSKVLLIYCNCGESVLPVPDSLRINLEGDHDEVYEIRYEAVPQLSKNEELKMDARLKEDFKSIEHLRHKEDLIRFSNDESVLFYYLCSEHSSFFSAYVDESIYVNEKGHDSLVGGDWQSKYVWVLFTWIKTKDIQLGVS